MKDDKLALMQVAEEIDDINFLTTIVVSEWVLKTGGSDSFSSADWAFDSAASAHMTNDMGDFIKGSIVEVNARVCCGNSTVSKVKYAGHVRPRDRYGNLIAKAKLLFVYYSKELPVKLISESILDKKGAAILRYNGITRVYYKGKVVMAGMLQGKLYRALSVIT